MLLIYSDKISPRLQYISQFIIGEQLGISYQLTDDKSELNRHEGAILQYAQEKTSIDQKKYFFIKANGLLTESGIQPVDIDILQKGKQLFLFPQENTDFPLDIFSAGFYLISRYEEYLPHDLDLYGRFSHTASVAFQHGFLNRPLLNEWIVQLGECLKSFFPSISQNRVRFSFEPTYDIDIAYAYTGKSFIRNLGGFIKNPDMERWQVLAGKRKDPFDAYESMDRWHHEYSLQPVYFFLVAGKRGKYDKNIDPQHPMLHSLIKAVSNKYKIGLHPSWNSNFKDELLEAEKNTLEQISGSEITLSRQHYIRFNLPDTFRKLAAAGIKEEYSMGYGSINGFRASTGSSFLWYDLEKEQTTDLRIFPFCFMEANSYYEQQQSTEMTLEEMEYYLMICRSYHCPMRTIFHNQFLGSDKSFKGWKEIYVSFLQRASLQTL